MSGRVTGKDSQQVTMTTLASVSLSQEHQRHRAHILKVTMKLIVTLCIVFGHVFHYGIRPHDLALTLLGDSDLLLKDLNTQL